MPFFDYCDIVWYPTIAKLTSMVDRVHSRFVKKLPSLFCSIFSFSLMEHCRLHTAVQIFKSLWLQSPPYLHEIFVIPQTLLAMLTGTLLDYLSVL